MTTVDIRINEATEPVDVVWATPDSNLWVATVAGEFAGMVEFADGHFVVTDHTGSVVTSESSIPAAQAALPTRVGLAQCA